MKEEHKNIIDNHNGVIVIDSGKPGETMTLVGCVHGNEPVGMEVIEYLLGDYGIKKKLKKGKLQLIIGNIEAYKNNSRIIDVDLNRIWSFEDKYKGSYEYMRARELEPYLKQTHYCIDMHSSSCETEPFFIPLNYKGNEELLRYLDVPYVIEDIEKFLHGKPLAQYVVDNNTDCFSLVIEAGKHGKEATKQTSIKNVLTCLSYFGFIEREESERKIYDKSILKVFSCAYAKSFDIKYSYSENPNNFDDIKSSELIFTDAGQKIFAETECKIILPSFPTYIGEEICYFAK